MICVYQSFGAGEVIPVEKYLKNKKLRKYFSRETSAAITVLGMMLENGEISDRDFPVFYSTGDMEFEDYGLENIVADSRDSAGNFSDRLFIEKGLSRVSPISQFKVLQNMPLCFISIEFGLTGDNAVIYSSAAGLLLHALYAKGEKAIIGAGRTRKDGSVEAGFALVSKEDLTSRGFMEFPGDAMDIFINLCAGQ